MMPNNDFFLLGMKNLWVGLGLGLAVSLTTILAAAQSTVFAEEPSAPAPKDWPAEMRTIQYDSPIDDSRQPAVFYAPESDQAVPLLVSLHTWGGTYSQPNRSRANWCINKRWALIAPDFRGPNRTPQACGSELAVADIVAAVEYARKKTKIDPDRIYLIGGSGGGYAAMLLAGRHPEIWAGVSAWCGITDLTDWHRETAAKKLHYAKDIEQSCGGPPGVDAKIDEQYRLRSSNTWIRHAVDVPLDLNHGIHDGHKGSVPVSHAIKAFNILASPEKRITDRQMAFFLEHQAVPEELRKEKTHDALYGSKEVLFRRLSGATRLTIFEGGHDSVPQAALTWLSHQNKKKPPVWNVAPGNVPASRSQSQEIDK